VAAGQLNGGVAAVEAVGGGVEVPEQQHRVHDRTSPFAQPCVYNQFCDKVYLGEEKFYTITVGFNLATGLLLCRSVQFLVSQHPTPYESATSGGHLRKSANSSFGCSALNSVPTCASHITLEGSGACFILLAGLLCVGRLILLLMELAWCPPVRQESAGLVYLLEEVIDEGAPARARVMRYYDDLEQHLRRHYLGYSNFTGLCEVLTELLPKDADRSKLRALDLGCGTGIIGKPASELLGFRLCYGVDGSREAGIICRGYVEIVENRSLTQVPHGVYDVVVSKGAYVPNHVKPNSLPFVGELLKPGNFCRIFVGKFSVVAFALQPGRPPPLCEGGPPLPSNNPVTRRRTLIVTNGSPC
uniref:Methyltransf_11 domain-containing protein n=1 Tax=Macrostomum lignano TaxID=282301 RepID=A0A1I8FG23_9PLAT